MDHGRVLALDTPAELKRSVGADTIVNIRTTGDPHLLAGVLVKDIEGVTRTREVDSGLEIGVKGSDRIVPRIVNSAERAGFDVVELSVAEPSLETVFIGLTGKELRD
jgi:ABC-2 type transport system ATP-binding protein